jgi:hypothetical protein
MEKQPRGGPASHFISLIVAVLFTFLFWLITLPIR